MNLEIVVPCFNEAQNIPLILDRFQQALTSYSEISESSICVVLVNNGSTDESAQAFENLLPKYKFARLVNVNVNQGYGYGILQGLATCKSEYIGWTHADMQTDPKDVLKAWNMVKDSKNENIFVKGLRRKRPIFDEFFTLGMSIFESIYLGKFLYDINAQPNIFPKSFFEKWSNAPHDFSLDLYALYMAKVQGLKVLRFDVLFEKRLHGESKWNTSFGAKWKFIKRTILFSRNLKTSLKG